MTGIKPVADPLAYYRKAPDGSELVVLGSHYSKPSEYPDALDTWKAAGWIPLYSAPAPELVAVLRKMVYGPGDQLPEAVSEARALLARIEGEQK